MDNEGIPDKESLRERFRKYRSGLSESRYAALSEAISRRLLSMPVIQGAETIHSFWPSVAKREVDIRPALNRFVADGKRLLLPVVDRDIPGRLLHVHFHKDTVMAPNRWGIHEPPRSEHVSPEVADVVIVPALCMTRDGCRIGYGRGYYDRFLREIDAPTVVPIFSEAIIAEIPLEAHDEVVDWLVSEKEAIATGRKRNIGFSPP